MDVMPPIPAVPPRPAAPAPPREPRDPLAVAVGNASLLGVGYLLLGQTLLAVLNWLGTLLFAVLLVTVPSPGWVQPALLLWWLALTGHGWYLAVASKRAAPAPPGPVGPVWPADETLVPGGATPPPQWSPLPAAQAQAQPRKPVPVRVQRIVAFSVAVPVLLAVGVLRIDAMRIENDAVAAQAADQCQRSQSILDGLWLGHDLVDPQLVARSADSIAACDILLRAEQQAKQGDRLAAAQTLLEYRAHPSAVWKGADDRRGDLFLAQAAAELRTGTTGDTSALQKGFEHLATVLKDYPRRARDVAAVVDTFAAGLPVKDPCDTSVITDWLRDRPASHNELDRAAAVVPQIAPPAIVGCGDQLMAGKAVSPARERYRQLLDEYPDDALAGRAKQGERKATLTLQLANVRKLLTPPDGSGDDQPNYCKEPAPYGGAKPYRGRGHGPYRALVFGQDGHRKQLPVSWRAKGAADAVLVVCAGEQANGSVVRTCPYTSETASLPPIGGNFWVSFHKIKVPVHVYELRTGKRVASRNLQIDGRACPAKIHYTTYAIDTGPPSDQYVSARQSDVREAYGSVIDP